MSSNLSRLTRVAGYHLLFGPLPFCHTVLAFRRRPVLAQSTLAECRYQLVPHTAHSPLYSMPSCVERTAVGDFAFEPKPTLDAVEFLRVQAYVYRILALHYHSFCIWQRRLTHTVFMRGQGAFKTPRDCGSNQNKIFFYLLLLKTP